MFNNTQLQCIGSDFGKVIKKCECLVRNTSNQSANESLVESLKDAFNTAGIMLLLNNVDIVSEAAMVDKTVKLVKEEATDPIVTATQKSNPGWGVVDES